MVESLVCDFPPLESCASSDALIPFIPFIEHRLAPLAIFMQSLQQKCTSPFQPSKKKKSLQDMYYFHLIKKSYLIQMEGVLIEVLESPPLHYSLLVHSLLLSLVTWHTPSQVIPL